jgi:hypothetical protein
MLLFMTRRFHDIFYFAVGSFPAKKLVRKCVVKLVYVGVSSAGDLSIICEGKK